VLQAWQALQEGVLCLTEESKGKEAGVLTKRLKTSLSFKLIIINSVF
jgi:hypothetical protein